MNVKADALDDVAFAVIGVQVPNRKECWCRSGCCLMWRLMLSCSLSLRRVLGLAQIRFAHLGVTFDVVRRVLNQVECPEPER